MIKVGTVKPPKFIRLVDNLTKSKWNLKEHYIKWKEENERIQLEVDREIYSWANEREIERFKRKVEEERMLNPYHIKSIKQEVCDTLIEAMEYFSLTDMRRVIKKKVKEMRKQGLPKGTTADKKNYLDKLEAFEMFLEVFE